MSLKILTNLLASILVTCLSHSLLLSTLSLIGHIQQDSLFCSLLILFLFCIYIYVVCRCEAEAEPLVLTHDPVSISGRTDRYQPISQGIWLDFDG